MAATFNNAGLRFIYGRRFGEIPFYCCLPVGLTLPGSFNHVPTFIFFPVRTTKSTSVSIDSESTTSQCYSQSFQYLIAGGLWRTGRPLNQSAERSNTLIIDGLNFACLNCTRLPSYSSVCKQRLFGYCFGACASGKCGAKTHDIINNELGEMTGGVGNISG